MKSLRGFNLGGFVSDINRSMQIPRFAGGGLADMKLAPASGFQMPGKSFDLIIGDRNFGRVWAPNQTAAELQEFARMDALSSAGRAPSWSK